ncbi:phage baseplate assembly protein W [Pedobacter sp. W3I1]|uniref:GPW/gp25 family protein n=1 Tax=Pedobacter sp. W3I1 TaxID=3042291 RepID=UPI00277FB93A|nr:GPW/gp25 family protein [Pedobacter sp. W3I1]MDQ0639632.1 phage baseplate assembly protein W [Pedobacter sp. W3I1]
MDTKSNFLGKGWAFPPEIVKYEGMKRFATNMVSDVTDINQSLEILFGTAVGERVMQAEYGCNVEDMIFEPINVTLVTRITERIRRAIIYYEPRIKLDKLDVFKNVEFGIINLVVEYTIRSTNTRNNIVYPYYLTEGTNI